MSKYYTITSTYDRSGTTTQLTGTLSELIYAFSHTLECGHSWEFEKGNKKINCNPKSIKSLITNLNNAVNNTASNGYSGRTFTYETITDTTVRFERIELYAFTDYDDDQNWLCDQHEFRMISGPLASIFRNHKFVVTLTPDSHKFHVTDKTHHIVNNVSQQALQDFVKFWSTYDHN